MIIRFFRAIVHEGKQEEFGAFFRDSMLPMVQSHDGLIDASIGFPSELSPREFCMVMRWRDLDALKGFAGEDWSEAVIHPDEGHLLAETHVHHYTAP